MKPPENWPNEPIHQTFTKGFKGFSSNLVGIYSRTPWFTAMLWGLEGMAATTSSTQQWEKGPVEFMQVTCSHFSLTTIHKPQNHLW